MRSPPMRTRTHAVALRALGTEPPVPRKTTERSTTQTVSGHAPPIRFSGCEPQAFPRSHQLAQCIDGPPIDPEILREPHASLLIVSCGFQPQPTLMSWHLVHG